MDALGEEVDFAAEAINGSNQDLRIQVVKATSGTTAFCLTADGVASVFANADTAAAVLQVWVACEFEAFQTESCRVATWVDSSCEVPTSEEELRVPDPRRLVKDFVGGKVPKSVFPSLLVTDAPAPSAVLETWRSLAVPRLLYSLVNEVVSTDKDQVIITGTRPRKVDADLAAPYSDALFDSATAAARWVYASGRDVDTRFALFTYELSREWPDGLTFKEGFTVRGKLALEAAETAFRAHVQETSKDTLKSLGDLRKTLSEEVTKVVTQTRDLLGTMWRDFMVAATAFLGRVVLLGTDKPLANPGPLKALLTGAAIFLVFSLVLSLRANWKFMAIADASREAWRQKLYGFMNNDDFKKLSDEPLESSTREYKLVRVCVIAAYIVVIGCLLWSAWGADVKAGTGGQSQSQSATSLPSTPAVTTPSTAAVSAPALPASALPATASKVVPVANTSTAAGKSSKPQPAPNGQGAIKSP